MTNNQTLSLITAISLITTHTPSLCTCHLTDHDKMKFHIIITLIAYIFKVESATICDSEFCVCHHDNTSDRDLIGEIVDCSYDPTVLRRNYDLPNTVYSLDLSRNNISTLPQTNLLKSNSLTELYLNINRIQEVTPDIFRLSKLKKLDLSDNELQYIHEDTFKNIKNLEYLNLANNRFTNFEKISFQHLGNLKEIVLDNNDLGPSLEENNLFDRSGYGLTHKVQSLSISGINLDTVHDNFFVDVYDLKRLIISNNNLVELFELPFTLEYLDLSGNPITQISGEDFADLLALKVLKLNNLWIKEIPDYAFANLRSLTNLELERNKNLTEFSVTAFGQEVLEDADDFSLETLSLKGSRLTSLNEKLEVPFGQLIRLDLQGNFWTCDCNLVWIKRLQIKPEDYDHLRCFSPTPLFNSRIFDLRERYFSCPVNSRHIGAIIAVSSFCIFLTALALWIFIVLPKHQSRCNFVRHLATPSAGYSVLPVSINIRHDL